jgi:hypothetical protein
MFWFRDGNGVAKKARSYVDGISEEHEPYKRIFVRKGDDSAGIDPLAGSDFTSRIGEVTSSPASNTLLARLKDLLTGIVLSTGSNVIGQVGLEARSSGGAVVYRSIDVDENGVNVKGSAGQVYFLHVINTSAGNRYLKLYNKATAPTVGTDTPAMTLMVPAGLDRTFDLAAIGAVFGAGIGIGATTGISDSDTGAPATNDVLLNILYK